MATTVAFAAVIAFSLVVILSQPIRSPWWIYAEADATYTASSANLFAGEHTQYLDHPGMPIQDLMAMVIETRYLVHKAGGGNGGKHDYAAARMLHLDDSRPYYRTMGALIYLLGAGLAFFVCLRLLGHPFWGLAGGLLWAGGPELNAESIQWRTDVLLSALVILTTYLIGRAMERRDALLFLAAGVSLGFTISDKLHAFGLVVPLALALLLGRPRDDWEPGVRARLRAFASRHRAGLLIGLAIWTFFAIVFNAPRIPFTPTSAQKSLAVGGTILVAGYVAAAEGARRLRVHALVQRLLDPLVAWVAVAVAAGLVLPATFFLDDGLQMLVSVSNGVTGRGVNQDIKPFTMPLSAFESYPLKQGVVLLTLAGLAAVIGALRRVWWPAIWFAGAASLTFLAMLRLGVPRYFAPPFVLCIPPALWLFRRRGVPGAIAATIVVAYVLYLPLKYLDAPANAAAVAEGTASSTEATATRLLEPGELALSDDTYPDPDVLYFELVDTFVAWTPPYPYRILPAIPRSLAVAQERNEHFRYYIGHGGLGVKPGPLQLGTGTYQVRPVPGEQHWDRAFGAVELLSGPGTTSP